MSSTLAVRALDSSEILTQITGQEVLKRDLTPRLMFLSAMTTVLVGVAYADGQLADREKLYLQKVLSQFVSPKTSLGKMISLMIKGIQKHKIYSRLDAIDCLTNKLSISEKLIILGFGHRLAIADGHAEAQERKYLNKIASVIDVSAQQVSALFACLDGKKSEVNLNTVKELRRLLDPQRFQNIDLGIVNAASFLSTKFLAEPKTESSSVRAKPSYAKLEKFQGYREQLSAICTDLMQVLKTEGEYDIFPSALEEEKKVQQLAQKVQSQKFRLAVVGEFSQGKSTFLNALVGEELQPVRAIPCSGTLTVLKYGPEKRVVCHYKDGTQSVRPFDQYKKLAAIPKEAALGNRKAKLEESQITEIVLEHPGLELCRHHVEIVDSPGLNEHPDRTAVTDRLLKNVDAAIFLANANRAMTEGERDLLQSLKHRLQTRNPEVPADNLFVLVNFMDMLQEKEDKAEVPEMVKNFVCDSAAPLVNSDNRVHFISAKLALAAILAKTTNEYSKPFSDFISALEKFLVEERGEISLREEIAKVKQHILATHKSLEQASNTIEGNLRLSATEKQRILEKTGEISGFTLKIQALKESLIEEVYTDVAKSWDRWVEGFDFRLTKKSEQWKTYHEDKEKIFADYREQSVKDISEDVDKWQKEDVIKGILEPKLDALEHEIISKLAVIKSDLQSIDKDTGTSLHEQFELSSLSAINYHYHVGQDALEDSTFFKVVATVFKVVTLVSIPGMIAGFISGKTAKKAKNKLRAEALTSSVAQFEAAHKEIREKLDEIIEVAFEKKAQDFNKAADASIAILCNLLKQQERILEKTLEQKEVGTVLIQKKSLQLQAIETTLNNLEKTALS